MPASIRRRKRITLTEKPPLDAAEGLKAHWWRENILAMSRPELAEALGIHQRTIERYEAMSEVPTIYRLACEALSRNNANNWAWTDPKTSKSLGYKSSIFGEQSVY